MLLSNQIAVFDHQYFQVEMETMDILDFYIKKKKIIIHLLKTGIAEQKEELESLKVSNFLATLISIDSFMS